MMPRTPTFGWPLAMALILPGAAMAADLDEVEIVWSIPIDGGGATSGNDEARGVVLAAEDTYLIAGWIDGAADEGDTAYLVKYAPDGTMLWDFKVEAGPVDGVVKTSSTDRFYDVATDNLGNIALAGALSADADFANTQYTTWLFDEDPITNPDPFWVNAWRDSADSPDQEAFAVCTNEENNIFVAGWSYRNAGAARGRWISYNYFGATGLANPDGSAIGENWVGNDFAIDQAHDVVVDGLGNIITVGTRGVSGTSGDDADTDLQVIKYDFEYNKIWEYTWAGAAGLEDGALSVDVDAGNDIVVAGYTNKGTDNGAGADFDWLMMRFPADGPLDTYGPTTWEVTWESAPGASEKATSVSIGDDNNILVGGFWVDGGVTSGKILQMGTLDGAIDEEWTAPTPTGDSAILSLDSDRGRVAMAGYEGNGSDRDFWAAVLEIDSDEDGVPDSIDGCPQDPDKIDPEICGCGEPEDDTDGDGTLDCVDVCPENPDKADDPGECGCNETEDDTDGDGTKDCIDNCPLDPNKTSLGFCGCGAADDDSDGDGVLGCDDACSGTPQGVEVDEFGCELGSITGTGTGAGTGTGTGTGGKDKCGCNSAVPAGGHGALLLGLGLLSVLRRRRQ